MSSDFKGRNESITSDDLYLYLSDCMWRHLGISREHLYEHFISIGKCEGSGSWEYFDRYNKKFNSNDYVGNSFDNALILSRAVGKQEYLSRSVDTAQTRRESISTACSSFIQDGLCDSFTISSVFPHLDCVDSIVEIKGVSGFIPCVEPPPAKYETLYAMISYTDSCGNGYSEPVPYYPISWDDDPSKNVFIKSTLENSTYGIDAEYHWEITRNANEVQISVDTASMDKAYIEIGTLSSAFEPEISVSLTYTEND